MEASWPSRGALTRQCSLSRFGTLQIRPSSGKLWRNLYATLDFSLPHVPSIARSRLGLLDRRAHEVPPLRPGAVVVPDVRVAEEVLQDEPRVARSLADAAVCDDLLVRRHAFRLVEGLQILRRLERPVLVDGLRPGDVLRSGDVSAALRVLRRIFRRREDLAAELLRSAHVDEDLPRLLVRIPDVRELDAKRLVRFLRRERRRRERRHVLRHGQVLLDPFLPTAVEEDDVVNAIILEHPERERREPVVEVAVEDDLMVVRDAEATEERLEALLRDDVPAHRIVDVLLPVDQDRRRAWPQVVVRRRVVVHLDDPHGLIADVSLDPARLDQNFGMRVSGHRPSLRAVRSITPLYSLRISVFASDYRSRLWCTARRCGPAPDWAGLLHLRRTFK